MPASVVVLSPVRARCEGMAWWCCGVPLHPLGIRVCLMSRNFASLAAVPPKGEMAWMKSEVCALVGVSRRILLKVGVRFQPAKSWSAGPIRRGPQVSRGDASFPRFGTERWVLVVPINTHTHTLHTSNTHQQQGVSFWRKNWHASPKD